MTGTLHPDRMAAAYGQRFRDYKPYDEKNLRIVRFDPAAAPNRLELENMEQRVRDILDRFTLGDYVRAKGGLFEAADQIERLFSSCPAEITGCVLEVGAGISKTSAVLSRLYDVSEIHCLDFSEALLKEIAPRVISLLGGRLDRFTFLVGDMNSIHELPATYDTVVLHKAVHHVFLPDLFFHRLHSKMSERAQVICLLEPAVPILLPSKGHAVSRGAVHSKRIVGENENVYSVREYRDMLGDLFDFQLFRVDGIGRWPKLMGRRLAHTLAPLFYFREFQISYIARKKPSASPAKCGESLL